MRACWVWTRPPAAVSSTRTTSCWSRWRHSATRSDPSAAARLRYDAWGVGEQRGSYMACWDVRINRCPFYRFAFKLTVCAVFVFALFICVHSYVHPEGFGTVCGCFGGAQPAVAPNNTTTQRESEREGRLMSNSSAWPLASFLAELRETERKKLNSCCAIHAAVYSHC